MNQTGSNSFVRGEPTRNPAFVPATNLAVPVESAVLGIFCLREVPSAGLLDRLSAIAMSQDHRAVFQRINTVPYVRLVSCALLGEWHFSCQFRFWWADESNATDILVVLGTTEGKVAIQMNGEPKQIRFTTSTLGHYLDHAIGADDIPNIEYAGREDQMPVSREVVKLKPATGDFNGMLEALKAELRVQGLM